MDTSDQRARSDTSGKTPPLGWFKYRNQPPGGPKFLDTPTKVHKGLTISNISTLCCSVQRMRVGALMGSAMLMVVEPTMDQAAKGSGARRPKLCCLLLI